MLYCKFWHSYAHCCMLDIMIHGKEAICWLTTPVTVPLPLMVLICVVPFVHYTIIILFDEVILTCQSGIVALCSWELPDSILFRVCTRFDICTAGCHRNENYWWRRKRQPLATLWNGRAVSVSEEFHLYRNASRIVVSAAVKSFLTIDFSTQT